MRIALIADIHANLPALKAVLANIHTKHAPDCILSLGDQVNLGPDPRETLALLRDRNVLCLHGNHERYMLGAMQGDPGYSGANFAALRFFAGQLTPQEITFPMQTEIEGAIFCHAMPDDDRFPVFDAEKAIPLLRARTFDKPTRIFCGHGHNPTHITMGNLSLSSIGSVGCMDDGVPGAAPYAILDIGRDYAFLRPYEAQFDVSQMPSRFRASGLADACPVMAHIVCLQMMHARDYLVPFVARAQQMAHEKGEQQISEATWKAADAAFDWPDGVSTAAFWR